MPSCPKKAGFAGRSAGKNHHINGVFAPTSLLAASSVRRFGGIALKATLFVVCRCLPDIFA
jgi:hypothetical protein